ncbi:neuroserpin-like [Convolutriloba macropyga]|uniref:neuroserpin-like n=1 Tax=Convolutriloba macropyga TaxID=536237 RepID=UPI003F51C559
MTELSFEAATDFSHSLLTNYTESCGGPNCVISPISIFLCLSMLKYGARGTTKSELDSVLFTPSESSGSEAQDIMRSLKESSDSAFKLNIANGIFIKDGFTPSSEFLIGLHYDFGARAQIVDLGSSAGVDEVNKWVKDETNGKITKLMAKPDESVMALINAVYMNAKWDEAFYEGSTKKGDFKVSDEKTVQVDLMQQTAEFKYVRDDDAKFRC